MRANQPEFSVSRTVPSDTKPSRLPLRISTHGCAALSSERPVWRIGSHNAHSVYLIATLILVTVVLRWDQSDIIGIRWWLARRSSGIMWTRPGKGVAPHLYKMRRVKETSGAHITVYASHCRLASLSRVGFADYEPWSPLHLYPRCPWADGEWFPGHVITKNVKI